MAAVIRQDGILQSLMTSRRFQPEQLERLYEVARAIHATLEPAPSSALKLPPGQSSHVAVDVAFSTEL